MITKLGSAPSGCYMQFFPLKGAFSSYAADAKPFPARNALLNFQTSVGVPFGTSPSSSIYTWVNDFAALMAPEMNGLHYQNYPDLSLGAGYGEGYFGTNWPRLRAVKTMYDPFRAFDNLQAIVPAEPDLTALAFTKVRETRRVNE